MNQFAMIHQPAATIYDSPMTVKPLAQGSLSAIADEAFYGTGIRVEGEETDGFLPVRTCYDYAGFMKTSELMCVSEETLKSWEAGPLMVVDAGAVDVLSVPEVKGFVLMTVCRGAVVWVEQFQAAVGWAQIRLVCGKIGYLPNQYLRKKEFSQAFLWRGELVQKTIVDEDAFREKLAKTAEQYLGVQYRWGGRSSMGIDCSGLTSVSYLLNGILIYRDAEIKPHFPVHVIGTEYAKTGDLLYFPGHIAMYLGEGRYIHATGKAGSSGVQLGSLVPGKAGYREDLAQSLYAVGSIFGIK